MIRTFIIFMIISLFYRCNLAEETISPKPVVIRDIDGNIYQGIKLDQIWLAENLKVTHYRNGDTIPQVQNKSEWYNLQTGAWCYYNNDSVSGVENGKLYNWYAVSDTRGLAPEGYHIASNEEWRQLTIFLGEGHGKALKSSSGWKEGGNGSNESGFNGYPMGVRFTDMSPDYFGFSGGWWTTTENYGRWALFRFLYFSYDHLAVDGTSKKHGLSVRCIRDHKKIENRYFRSLNTFFKRLFNKN